MLWFIIQSCNNLTTTQWENGDDEIFQVASSSSAVLMRTGVGGGSVGKWLPLLPLLPAVRNWPRLHRVSASFITSRDRQWAVSRDDWCRSRSQGNNALCSRCNHNGRKHFIRIFQLWLTAYKWLDEWVQIQKAKTTLIVCRVINSLTLKAGATNLILVAIWIIGPARLAASPTEQENLFCSFASKIFQWSENKFSPLSRRRWQWSAVRVICRFLHILPASRLLLCNPGKLKLDFSCIAEVMSPDVCLRKNRGRYCKQFSRTPPHIGFILAFWQCPMSLR